MPIPASISIPHGYRAIRPPIKPQPGDLGFILDSTAPGTQIGMWVDYETAESVDANVVIRPTRTTVKRAKRAAPVNA